MGQVSVLKIGSLVFEWKDYIPNFLTFLFDKSDFFCKPKTLKYEDEWFNEIGYSTTCHKSLEKLDSFGYNLAFFSEVYGLFYNDIESTFLYYLGNELSKEAKYELDEDKIDLLIEQHLNKYPEQGREDDLLDFLTLIKKGINSRFNVDEFNLSYELKLPDNKIFNIPLSEFIKWRRTDFADFSKLQMYFFDNMRHFPPSISKVSLLFDEHYLFEYPEIILLMYTRIILEATPKNRKITLDLADITETIEEVELMHSNLADSLSKKIYLYNRVFNILAEQKSNIQDLVAKTRCRDLISQLNVARNNNEKGKVLEELMLFIFESKPELEVIERRFNNGDEEIDLILKNNLSKPFWVSLSSPLIFIECKNWIKPVGSKELRDFEIKLQNHRPLVRLGFFVAPGGFTSEFYNELRRTSRDYYTIVPINLNDIVSFINGIIIVSDWMEAKICRPL